MALANDYILKLASEFIDDLAQAQRNTYDLLSPHSGHHLEVTLDDTYNVVYARCNTCDITLLDLENPDAPETDPPTTQPDTN